MIVTKRNTVLLWVLCLGLLFKTSSTFAQSTISTTYSSSQSGGNYTLTLNHTVLSGGNLPSIQTNDTITFTVNVLGEGIQQSNTFIYSSSIMTQSILLNNSGVFDVIVDIELDNTTTQRNRLFNIRVEEDESRNACCGNEFTYPGNEFNDRNIKYFDETGAIGYYDESTGEFQNFNCFEIDEFAGKKVISASAQVFDSIWDIDYMGFAKDAQNLGVYPNNFEQGRFNKWRVSESYTYKEELDQDILNSPVNEVYRNYDRGTFIYEPFLWTNLSFNDYDKWIKTSRIVDYSPNGNPIREVNALGVSSGALYGYNNTQMIAAVQNARYFEIAFESFENVYQYELNGYGTFDGFDNSVPMSSSSSITRVDDVKHTGAYSLKVNNTTQKFDVAPVKGLWMNTNVFDGDGVMFQCWIKSDVELQNLKLEATHVNSGAIATKSIKKVQSCGEWSLYEGVLDATVLSSWSAGRIKFKLYNASSQVFYIDDVRIQPVESEMVTYVFDDEYRLVANFDSQHFALLYQYNEEGKLIRKLKETVNGIVTLSETRYNNKGKIR